MKQSQNRLQKPSLVILTQTTGLSKGRLRMKLGSTSASCKRWLLKFLNLPKKFHNSSCRQARMNWIRLICRMRRETFLMWAHEKIDRKANYLWANLLTTFSQSKWTISKLLLLQRTQLKVGNLQGFLGPILDLTRSEMVSTWTAMGLRWVVWLALQA